MVTFYQYLHLTFTYFLHTHYFKKECEPYKPSSYVTLTNTPYNPVTCACTSVPKCNEM